MKERPILFSGAMVRSILDGRKTQTRRIVKPQPKHRIIKADDGKWYDADCINPGIEVNCRYGKVGDRLWVKETFNLCGGKPFYRADGKMHADWKWKPSIFMPRFASRITLEITDVRVERLNAISVADVKAEGIFLNPKYLRLWTWDGIAGNSSNPVYAYQLLWDSINEKTHPWISNPFVWVITFRRLPLVQSLL